MRGKEGVREMWTKIGKVVLIAIVQALVALVVDELKEELKDKKKNAA